MRLKPGRAVLMLPLGQDASSRLGPWIIGAMVYVAAIALAGAMILTSAGEGWEGELAGKISVQVPPSSGDTNEAVERVVRMLRATPGIAEAEPLDATAMRELLAPWLGARANLDGLPLPALIDVRVDPAATIDARALEASLSAKVPGTAVDDHGLWVGQVLRFADVLRIIGFAIVLLIGMTAIVTVIFATRAGLSVHDEVIEILHLIGAHDSFIAGQFQIHVRTLALQGGVIGWAAATATLILLGYFAPRGEASMLPEMSLSALQWFILACLPLIATGIGMATARITVIRALSRVI